MDADLSKLSMERIQTMYDWCISELQVRHSKHGMKPYYLGIAIILEVGRRQRANGGRLHPRLG